MLYLNRNYIDYSFLPNRIKRSVQWLLSFDLKKLNEDKYFFSKKDFAIKKVLPTQPRNKCLFESHKKYIDLHYILSGEEIFEIAHPSQLKLHKKYNPDIEAALYKPPKKVFTSLTARAGDIVVLYPEDVHMPLIRSKNVKKVKKVILKIKVK